MFYFCKIRHEFIAWPFARYGIGYGVVCLLLINTWPLITTVVHLIPYSTFNPIFRYIVMKLKINCFWLIPHQGSDAMTNGTTYRSFAAVIFARCLADDCIVHPCSITLLLGNDSGLGMHECGRNINFRYIQLIHPDIKHNNIVLRPYVSQIKLKLLENIE